MDSITKLPERRTAVIDSRTKTVGLKSNGEHILFKDRLKDALEEAESKAEQERQTIRSLTHGETPERAKEIWDEEASAILLHLDDEIRVAETNLLLRDARKYHLPTPDWSEKDSWYVSQLSGSRYLSPNAERNLQRTLLEESRREDSARRARQTSWIAISSLIIAALALLKDIPIGSFLVDIVKAFKI